MVDSQQSGATAGADADLSAAVTVFVTTVGAPTFAACLAHLAAQDCRVTLRVIAHVAPMHATVRRYPLAPIDHFEVDQVRRFEADGHTVMRAPAGLTPLAGQTLGRHGTQWTAPSIYERYATLERRRRETPPRSDWFSVCGAEFLTRFQRQPTEENFPPAD